MPTHKIAELTGPALDLSVALSLDYNLIDDPVDGPNRRKNKMPRWHKGDVWVGQDGRCYLALSDNQADYFEPSSNWAQGGPLIDKYRPEFTEVSADELRAGIGFGDSYSGPTHLIAAMRALVASSYGEEIELPEITNEQI